MSNRLRRVAGPAVVAIILLGGCAGRASDEETAAPPTTQTTAGSVVMATSVVATTVVETTPSTQAPTAAASEPSTTAVKAFPTIPKPAPAPAQGVPARLSPPGGLTIAGAENVPFSGFWNPIGPDVGGSPAMFATRVPSAPGRATAVSVAWIDPGAVRAQFQPGTTDPPGPWATPSHVLPEWQSGLAVVFNGGFKSKDARGGIFLDGRAAPPLRDGAASAVITRDGVLTVGQWGRDVGMSDGVVSVRQNLDLMVDNGHSTVVDNAVWGATLKGAVRVARSAVGVRSDGAIIYVGGPDMTAKELGDVLVNAGCLRAMELDINPTWVTFTSFVWNADTATPDATKLNDAMVRSPQRFLTDDERDFFSLFVRP